MSGSFGGLVPWLVIALLVVLVAAAGAIFLVRRLGAGGRHVGAPRGRVSRLAMVDSTSIIDGRKLVIVRRDNVEHLLLIGGATDVLVEGNIVRGAAVAHASAPEIGEAPVRAPEPEMPARISAPEPVARAPEPQKLPLTEGTKWPLQPEPVQRSKRASEDGMGWPLQAQGEPATHLTNRRRRAFKVWLIAARNAWSSDCTPSCSRTSSASRSSPPSMGTTRRPSLRSPSTGA